MAELVSVNAGEKGHYLCELWARVGHHMTSDTPTDLDDASVVLFGGSDPKELQALSPRLAGKIIIDCSNPSDVNTLRAQPSMAETLAKAIPEVQVVKALNAITVDALATIATHGAPKIGTVYASEFYCGDDDEAKRVVAGLLSEINLDPIDCGPLSNAILLEGLGVLERYLEASAFGPSFVLTVLRPETDRSPLDRLF